MWDVLAEAREHILHEELYEVFSSGDTKALDAYRYMSQAFFRPVLAEAAERGAVDLVRRCVELVERMLASGDDTLIDVVRIRVIDKVGQVPALGPLLRRYAGPLTREALAMAYADATYLPPGDPFPVRPPVDDGRPPADARRVRAWLWDNVARSRSYLLTAERAAARATMSLRAMTAGRYLTEALAPMVAEAREDTERQNDPEPVREARAGLARIRADPVMGPLLREYAPDFW